MSADDVKIVQRAFAAFGTTGIEAVLPHLAPDIVWTVRDDLPDAGVYRGHEGVRTLFARFDEVLEDIGFETQGVIDAGDHVVVTLHWWGRGTLSGAEVGERDDESWVFTVRDGMIAEIHEYAHKDDALRSLR